MMRSLQKIMQPLICSRLGLRKCFRRGEVVHDLHHVGEAASEFGEAINEFGDLILDEGLRRLLRLRVAGFFVDIHLQISISD
jgi:hypothetical protein